ncbi:MAG: agmatine deiminase family protein, partial [Candidatus Cloacimonadaceae bacterium]|nr:agmatine deiminase family protein [Candidatus Cloacimonadaceae bacterium]
VISSEDTAQNTRSVNDLRPEPWLSISPLSGTIAAGGNAILTVTLNSAGLADGTYNDTIVIASNAANQPVLSVPVTFTVFNPYPVGPRFVAEWEPAKGALIRYPFGQPYGLIADMSNNGLLYVIVTSASQSACNSALSSNGVNMANVRYLNAASDSYWTRDYGPWTIFDANNQMKIVDFTYNRPRPNDNLIPSFIANNMGLQYYTLPLNHTGGNIMTDGMGKAMSSQLVLSENSSYTQNQINQLFQNYLGVTEYQLYVDPLANSSIDHIDCWAKLLDVDKVIIAQVPSGHSNYAAIEAGVAAWQTKTSSYGTPYRIFRTYAPNNEPYTNSYIMNKKIYVPQMGTANDAAALAVYQSAMPGYTIVGYSHSNYLSDDAIHCRVNTIYDDQMVALDHVPPTSATAGADININVSIQHHNPLDPAFSFVAWRHSPLADWQYAPLTNSAGRNWSAAIPAPALGQSVYYWIKAQDTMGKNCSMPLCAGGDPFAILVDIPGANNAPEINLPDSFGFDMNGQLTV